MNLPRLSRASKRTTILLYLLLAVLGLFALRLFYLQVIQYGYYTKQAQQMQVSKLTIVPERGKVYALDGKKPVPLVLNETVYTVFADPQEVEDISAINSALRDIAGGNLVDGYRERLSDETLRYVPVARQLTRTQAEKLRAKELAGIGFQKGSRRVYPEGQMGSQMLGYVNNDGIGQYGLEGALNTQLTGQAGLLQTVTDVRQIPLTVGQNEISRPAVDGTDLVLSIDRNIQQKTEEVLSEGLKKAKATKGSVLVMDPNTGRVMAMANLPTYDANKYGEVEDYGLFVNGVVNEPYEVGSVMKVLSMGVGLDTGAVTVNSTYNNTGCVRVDGFNICNVEEDPIFPGTTMTDVLQYSLNTGVVHVLERMGGGSVNKTARETLYDYYTGRYRFDQLTGIEQAGEAESILVGPNQGQGRNVRYANMTFGQGMNITMIQTAAAFSAAMNGGTYYQPTMIQGIMKSDGTVAEQAPKVVQTGVLSPETSATLREMTYQGRNKGFFGRLDPDGYMIGGKTGTTQVIDPETGKYSDDDEIGSYLGFGGADKPEYVIMVRVDNPKIGTGYAGTVAAGPIFNELSEWMLKYLEIPPKN
jgi:cell division protein FtsI (penicillin-binding protein 3)